MNIFRIRILVDDQDDFIREIEVKSNQTFKVLHDFIVKSLKLGGDELASFHITDESWNKLQEITLIDMTGLKDKKVKTPEDLPSILIMDKTRLDAFLFEIDQKMIYEYDFLQMHTFRLEVIDIDVADAKTPYPNVSFSKGKLSLEDSVKVEKDPEKLKSSLLAEFNSMINNKDDDDDNDYDVDDDY